MSGVRIISEPLGGSALSRFLQSADADRGWLPPRPRDPAAWRAAVEATRRRTDWKAHWDALDPAIKATGEAANRLARVRREGGVVVTTGQQPGLFGGPLYTWSKAISALAIADAIESATNVPAAALFWAATDDADFAEASSTIVATARGLEELRATNAPAAGTPMSLAALGDLSDALARLRAACGSAPDPRVLEAMERAYAHPGRTVGDAFVMLLRELLAPLGVPVIDASHAAVAHAGASTLQAALHAAPEIERALHEREQEISAAGYDVQVPNVRGLSLVFTRESSTKRRLTISESATAKASSASPNVLLRPIVERAILPTIAYVAGPGEIAYFAQVSAASRALGKEAPLAIPRWSCTLIEPEIDALLQRYSLVPSELAELHNIEGRIARAAMSESSQSALGRIRAAIAGLPYDLEKDAHTLGLDRAVQGAVHTLQHRIDRLERRLAAGVKRRETERFHEIATIRAALFPRGIRQERLLNPMPLLARHGLSLLDEMRVSARPYAMSLVDPAHSSTAAPA